MYIEGTAEFEHHIKTYGPHKDFGYKDFIPMFKSSQLVMPVASDAQPDMRQEKTKFDPENFGERIYGERCPVCSSSQLYRNGTCKVCKECGTTTGCS
jgi:hypothetical protein